MSLAITIGGLLLATGGAITMFGDMSDDSDAGLKAGKQGCLFLGLGAALFVSGAWGLLS